MPADLIFQTKYDIFLRAHLRFLQGGGFSKKRPFCQPFFQVDQIDFPITPRAIYRHYFDKNFCATEKTIEETGKEFQFYGVRISSKIVYIAPLENFQGWSAEKRCRKLRHNIMDIMGALWLVSGSIP